MRPNGVIALIVVVLLAVSGVRPARAQHPVMTATRVNLRADSLRTSHVLRVLRAHAQLEWDGTTADHSGMFRVVTVDESADSGWVAGEYLLEAPSMGVGHHGGAAPTCGVARWPVKTLSDPDAGSITTTPKTATIASLRALPKPKQRPQNGRANQVEKTVYQVSGKIIEWGLEADSDIHLVLASPSNSSSTIVMEIPDPGCVDGASPAMRDQMKAARDALIAKLGQPPGSISPLTPAASVTATGVGFFDQAHSKGHPPNAFELHPVLSLAF